MDGQMDDWMDRCTTLSDIRYPSRELAWCGSLVWLCECEEVPNLPLSCVLICKNEPIKVNDLFT